jgi:hypothetical protein
MSAALVLIMGLNQIRCENFGFQMFVVLLYPMPYSQLHHQRRYQKDACRTNMGIESVRKLGEQL